jgi:hypothetical protein
MDVWLLDDVEDEDVDDDVTVLEIKTAVMETVPELAALLASPGYAASIVTAPGVSPVTNIEQLPPVPRLHVGGEVMLTLPVSPDGWENVTVSPFIVPAAPVTVAVHVEKPGMLTEEGAQETEVLVAALVTVTLAVPELAASLASPGYDAWMVTGPGMAPVAVTEQLVPERVQVAGDGSVTLPVPAVWEKVTDSPERLTVAPDTVAVQDEVAPAVKDAGVQETEVVVVAAVAVGEYWNVVVCVAEPLLLPHTAFTVYPPEIQLTVPPATIVPLYAPVEGLTGSSW